MNKNKLLTLPVCFLDAIGVWPKSNNKVTFVTEKADWSIRWDGKYICDGIEQVIPGYIKISDKPELLAKQVVHFGSQFQYVKWADAIAKSNKVVVSYFHGKREDGPEMALHVDDFIRRSAKINRIVTAARLVEDRLIGWGIPKDKIVRIPIAVDLEHFVPRSIKMRLEMRRRYGISEDQLCIGSFQKDGVGWDDGDEPKHIKGPDTLLEVVAQVAREEKVFVLLTGPARGYVKRGLKKLGVPFFHDCLQNYRDIVSRYAALDVYINPSREEGGPKGILEAMATHVPVVSTRVGMAPDIIVDGVSGGLVDVGDVDGLTKRILATARKSDLEIQLETARNSIRHCDVRQTAIRHLAEVYKPIVECGL